MINLLIFLVLLLECYEMKISVNQCSGVFLTIELQMIELAWTPILLLSLPLPKSIAGPDISLLPEQDTLISPNLSTCYPTEATFPGSRRNRGWRKCWSQPISRTEDGPPTAYWSPESIFSSHQTSQVRIIPSANIGFQDILLTWEEWASVERN